MKLNRNEHSRFIQWLDRTAEKNPLLWLPCILLIALALAGEHIAEYVRIVYSHRNIEKIVKEKPQLERKPFALRAVAISLTLALSFMIVPDLSGVISFNAFATNTYIADNFICEIVGNEVTINGFDDNNQRYKASGEIVIPTSVIINNNSYVVTGISDNAFSNLTYITALVIPNTVSKIGNNILSEKFLNTEEIDLYHIFCNSDSYAYTYLKEKQYPEHVIILMDSSDFLPINVFKSDYILGIFIDGKTTYETLITSERTYKTMLEEFDDNLAFKCGITSWQTLTFETSNLVDIFKDEHDFYLTYLCEILQSKYYKTQFDLAEMSDTINITANALEIFEECGIDYNDRKTLTGEQLYELEKASVKLLKFDTSYVQPFKEFIKTGKSATEIINIICNMYYLSLISDETVEFLNIMKQNTNNASLKLAIDEVIASTINLPLLITEQVMLSQSETCVKKALGSIVDDIIGKNPACIALKFVRDGGQYIVNSVFSTEDIIKQYYTLKYFVELEDVIKKSCCQVENNFRQSRSEKNADVFLAGVDVYFQSIQYGYDCIDKMAKIVYQDSLMGWNADKYDSFHESAVKIKKEISDAYDQYGYVYRYISIYYRSEYSKHIPVESIAFAKESVEWGLNDKYFYGYSCSITPPNADNVEIVYTTSDSAVAEIENGIAKVHGVGNCVITATSVDNPKAFDTLNVTVIEGSGADSSLDEILPSYEDNYEYTISNGEVTITKYIGTDTDVVIPKTIKGKPVRYISGAFENNKNITSVQIQDSVGSIGWSTFENCTNLTSITIPDSVTSIGGSAFYCCTSLISITIPNSVTSIGKLAFYGCSSLASITIPDNVTSIDSAFNVCTSLTSITIPDSVISIDSAFNGCTSLTSITIPDSVTSIGKRTFSGCTNLASITIPDSVTSIGSFAFSGCTSLTTIPIPDSVTSIGSYAFLDCAELTNIIIPDSVVFIDDYAFRDCTGLTSITIPNSVNSMGYWSFKNFKNLTEVTLPNSITSIGDDAFNGCTNLMNITVPDNVTSIGGWAFKDCISLTNIIIPNSVTSIGYAAFSGCKNITSITIPSSVTSIEGHAFAGCISLINITIPNSVVSMGYWSFENFQNLTSITLPNSVTSIGNSAFSGCTSLTSITIPDSVTSIGDSAFHGCTSLTSITIPDSVVSIDNYAFSGCTSLTSITIPDSVTSIGNSAFSGCTSLTTIPIPDSVTSIGDSAFHGCTSLINVIIPDSVTSIGYSAFGGCTNLISITIPDNVASIGSCAFNGCTNLISITIPDSVTLIGALAFRDCKNLKSITIPNSVISIEMWTFDNCTYLKSIIIPDSVTYINDRAFDKCLNLTIYGYEDSYAEKYANKYRIPFVYLDDVPIDKVIDIIETADENSTLTIDTSKYGTDLTAEEVSAAKVKNLTLIINGNNFSWQTKATDLPNTTVDFKLISPSGNVDRSQFNESYKNRSFDFKTVNPSGAELTYNVGAENDGCCGNIFKVGNGNFTLVSSDLVDNGQITFIPSYNSTYCIVISTDSNPISTDELFEKTPVVNTALDSLSVNGATINGFSPDKTDYTYPISYADWSADKNKTYSISASANNSANVTISDNDFTLNSDNSDTMTVKNVTVTVINDSGEQTVYTVKFVVEACPHTNRIENISKNPTCADLGGKETVCELCGKQFGFESIPALGHDFDDGTITSEPDCVNMGTITHQCSRCSESFTRTIPALGHIWGELTVDTAATCTTDGSSSRHCERCGAHGSVTLIPASGHSFGAWTKVNDTTYERVCAVCGIAETTIITDPSHDHIFNGRSDIITPATCQNVGSRNVYCSVDGCTEFVTETIAKAAHTPNETINVNATCTTAGSSTVTCAVCGVQISETEIPATGHSFTNYTDTATCTLPGIKTAECDNGCGASDSIPTPAKGHSYGDWLKDGRGHWHECSVCRSTTDIISHSENEGVITIQPTETTEGVKTYSCTECGYVIRTDVIDPIPPMHTEHEFDRGWHSNSSYHWHECTVCGAHSDTERHNENNVAITVQPTVTTSGTRTYSCSVCGYTVRTENIPPIDPNPPYPTYPTYPTYPAETNTPITNEPYIYGDTSKSGWDAIISEIDFAADGSTVRVNMNDTYELSKDVVSRIQNRNINLELHCGGAVWTINGLDVTDPKTVNMRVSDRYNKIPASVIDSLNSELSAKELQLYHNGDFGFKATLTVGVGKKYNNYYGALYHYNTKTKQLEFVDESLAKNRQITFELTHASYYAMAFNSTAMYDDVSASAGVFEGSVPIETSAMPETSGVTIPAIKLPQIMKYSNKKRKYRILKKRRLDGLVFVL